MPFPASTRDNRAEQSPCWHHRRSTLHSYLDVHVSAFATRSKLYHWSDSGMYSWSWPWSCPLAGQHTRAYRIWILTVHGWNMMQLPKQFWIWHLLLPASIPLGPSKVQGVPSGLDDDAINIIGSPATGETVPAFLYEITVLWSETTLNCLNSPMMCLTVYSVRAPTMS